MSRPIVCFFRKYLPGLNFESFLPILLLLASSFSCRDDGIEPTITDLHLTVVDINPTEVWLHLKSTVASGTVSVSRDDGLILGIYRSPVDTFFLNDSLRPLQTYRYEAAITSGFPRFRDRVQITTLDTTSHNFTWQVDTVGIESSGLYGAAIMNDTSVWVVGELYGSDTSGQLISYNAAHWDGEKWTLIRILYPYQGALYYANLRSIFAFSSNDFWVGSNQPMHWNGTRWETFDLLGDVWNGWIARMWGTSSSNLTIVGSNGAIAHYDGHRWQKQESGTSSDLTDVWGIGDGSQIWACGNNEVSGASALVAFHRSSGSWRVLWDAFAPNPTFPYRYSIQSLWTPGRGKFIITGGEVYYHSLIETSLVQVHPFEIPNYAYCVRGSSINNACLIGDYAMVMHYNGSTWHLYEELRNADELLYGLSVSDRLVVAVGTRYLLGASRTGLVIMGRR